MKLFVREQKFLVFQFIDFEGVLYLEAMPISIADIDEDRKLQQYWCQKVTDSSRYFVIWIKVNFLKQTKKKTIFLFC